MEREGIKLNINLFIIILLYFIVHRITSVLCSTVILIINHGTLQRAVN